MADVGRPSKFTPEIADEICSYVSNSLLGLTDYCKQEGKPHRDTIYQWMKDNKDFSDNYARARELKGDYLDEQIQLEANTATSENWQVKRLKIDTMKWRACHLAPRRYSDKMQVSGEGGGPLQISVVKFSDDSRKSDT